MNFAESTTRVNLMRAFAGESMARNRYAFAASVAQRQNMYIIQQIFNFTAHQETEHAKIFYDLMKEMNGCNIDITAGYPVGNYSNLAELLRDAEKHEREEHTQIYPEFAQMARSEGFEPIALAFEQIAAIELTHENRFASFAQLIEESRLFKGNQETAWTCLNCGHVLIGKDAPPACPVCKHAQGYYVPEKYYKFVAEDYTKP